MNKMCVNKVLLGVGLFYVFATILATTSVTAAQLKIGFVNAARVLEEAPQAEKAQKLLEKEFSSREKKLVVLQRKIKKLDEKLSRDGAVMSEPERRRLEREIISNKRELKRSREEFREDLNIRRNDAFEKLRRRVYKVIVFIAEKEKYDLIVSDGVIFASKQIDITNAVVEQLKNESAMRGDKKAQK
jgi:outer membrane protein